MNRIEPKTPVIHKGIRMMCCKVLTPGNDKNKAEITACRYHKGKPLTRSPEYIGIEWEAEEKK